MNQIEGPWPILGARQESLLSRVGPSKTSLREGEEGSHAGIGEGEVVGDRTGNVSWGLDDLDKLTVL